MTVFTDSKYTFLAVYAHGAIWKEGGLLNSGNREIKKAKEILEVLEVVLEFKEVAIVPCLGHQKLD